MTEYIIWESNKTETTDNLGVKHSVSHFEKREEIVRCMDCAWFTNSSHYGAYCTNFGSPLHDDYDGFCAWGERRES